MSQIIAQSRVNDMRRQLTREELDELDRMMLAEKKSSGLVAGLAAIGFLGVSGIHRFALGDIGMGILMLVTFGGCGIWTIVDLARSQTIANNYNMKLELDAISSMLERRNAPMTYAPPSTT